MSTGRVSRIEIPRPHSGQIRCIREARRFNVLMCGRRFGKTQLGEQVAIETAIEGWPVGWFAPTNKIMTPAWDDVEKVLRPMPGVKIDKQERRITLPTGGSIDFWSVDNPDSGRGRKYKRAIVDEAGIVRDLGSVWQQAIRPTLADYRGDAWFLGTPKGRGYFHAIFTKGQDDGEVWKSWRMGTADNPYIPKDEIEAARNELPESAFNQEFLGIPADDGGNPFGLNAIRSCILEMSDEPPVCYGIDLAKSHDWTVAVGLDGEGRVCVLERWQGQWSQTMARLREMIGETPALIDSTGVGDPIVEELQLALPNVEGFKFTAPSKQQIMERLASSIQQGTVRFPEGWLANELESFEYQYRASGVRYSAPEGLHDDGVCALALAVQHHQAGLRNAFAFRVI